MPPPICHTSTILKEIPTYGSHPLLVLTEEYDQYVIKHSKGHSFPIDILNEFICTFLLEQWMIRTPSSALVHTEQALITSLNSSNHKSRFYKVPSFGSCYNPNTTELSAFGLVVDTRHDYNRLADPLQFFHIALFDVWISNVDRHGGNYNLIVQQNLGKLNFIPIDHAFVFEQLSYEHLDPKNYHPISNEHLLDSDIGKSIRRFQTINEAFIASEEQYFYICLEKCNESINVILNWLSGEYMLDIEVFSPLLAYLFDVNRNGKVFEEYKDRLSE